MNPRKALMIIVVLLVVGVGLLILNKAFNRDSTPPQLQKIVTNDQTIISLATEASKNLSLFELQTKNATLLATTTSDNVQLVNYYKKRYKKDLSKNKGDSAPVTELKATQAGTSYDNKYKELVKTQLEANSTAIKSVFDQSKTQQLKDLMQMLYTNQGTALQQLNK